MNIKLLLCKFKGLHSWLSSGAHGYIALNGKRYVRNYFTCPACKLTAIIEEAK